MRIMRTKQNQGQAEQVTENPRRRAGGSNQPKLTRRRQIRGEDPGGQPVALADRTLTCVECGGEFIFSAGEQEFFQARGFGNEPKRCRSCRAVRRSEQRSGGMYQDGPREMYPINCAECGQDAMVPFRPRGDRPVYCSDCFSKMRTESSPGL
jgi:CxxC-x17-CxxC domain-containing protein